MEFQCVPIFLVYSKLIMTLNLHPGQLGGNPADPEVSPLLYPSHRGLPPALIQICGLDPLRDEALLYDRILRDDGVKTKTIT